MTMFSWLKLFMVSFLLFLLISASSQSVDASSEDAANSFIIEAEDFLASAYEHVLVAERAGANVSDLLHKLTLGGNYLAEANVWYRLGSFENASRLAGLCCDVVVGVRSEALELQDEAISVGDSVFTVTVITSVAGVLVSVVLGFAFWSVFKRRYYRRVLGLMPEVSADES